MQPLFIRLRSAAATDSTTWHSAPESGSNRPSVARLSSTCSGVDIPLKITFTPGWLATQRMAQDAQERFPSASANIPAMSSGREARVPPFTGSMTITGIPDFSASSYPRSPACTWRSI